MIGITLAASSGGAASKTGAYYINGKVRKLSPREAARLQGFPDSFKLELSDTRLYTQFGNSVTVNVIQAIANRIREVLENNE
mgnify:CR=1 FL=1